MIAVAMTTLRPFSWSGSAADGRRGSQRSPQQPIGPNQEQKGFASGTTVVAHWQLKKH